MDCDIYDDLDDRNFMVIPDTSFASATELYHKGLDRYYLLDDLLEIERNYFDIANKRLDQPNK